MANVIEFYVPVRFRKAVKWVHPQQRGRARISGTAKANRLSSAS